MIALRKSSSEECLQGSPSAALAILREIHYCTFTVCRVYRLRVRYRGLR
jgi:hypothetical protein